MRIPEEVSSMVSIDLSHCSTTTDRITWVLRQDSEAILAMLDTVDQITKIIEVIHGQLNTGHKIITVGAGASALVAMEMAGQGIETGLPIISFTNNLSDAAPISFAKGLAEGEAALSRYINLSVSKGDVVIGVSASGGTGFVYDTMRRAQEKGAITIGITENVDAPVGQYANYLIQSRAKPEGPSSSKVQIAHLAIGHAIILSLADERGVTAEESLRFMQPETIPTKKMGAK